MYGLVPPLIALREPKGLSSPLSRFRGLWLDPAINPSYLSRVPSSMAQAKRRRLVMMMKFLPPQPPPKKKTHTHSSRHGPQHTQHTASTAATPRHPQGRRRTPADAPTPLTRGGRTHHRRLFGPSLLFVLRSACLNHFIYIYIE